MNRKDLKPRERSLIDDLKDALIGSETFSELARATNGLLRLIAADCMALCVSRPGPSGGYLWLPTDMPMEFFDRGAEWERDDFLRRGVILHPGTVMRDTDLISPEALRHNAMYRISRELGMPLSHAVSVLLPFPGLAGQHGGFTAYRSGLLAFSERDKQLLQQLAHLLAMTLQKCQKLMNGDLYARLFGSVVRDKKVAVLVLEPPDRIIEMSDPVSSLVRDWFSPSECTKTGVPKELLVRLAALVGRMETETWTRTRGEESLEVTFTPLPRLDGALHWQLKFEERWQSLFQTRLKTLTRKETQVSRLLQRGLENKEIAPLVKCRPTTVKEHVDSIFLKTGVHSRKEFIFKSLERPPEKP